MPAAATVGRKILLLLSPFLYLAGVVAAVVGVMILFTSMEYGGLLYPYMEPLYRLEDLTPSVDEVGLAVTFAVGGITFGLLGWALVGFDGTRRPGLTDHLRRCACLYVFFAIVSARLIPEVVKAYQFPRGYPPPETLSQVVWLLTVYAILIDATILALQRWRSERSYPRSGA